jgi:hypothetical protein
VGFEFAKLIRYLIELNLKHFMFAATLLTLQIFVTEYELQW